MNHTITILMATYNGSKFLREQLDSILAQTYTDWQLFVRDDGSVDDTIAILKEYESIDPRIKFLELAGPHGSAAINFGVLFNYTRTQSPAYLMFADQDDCWNKDKIAISLESIQREEIINIPGLPLMMYSSFQFVDENSNKIHREQPLPDKLTMPVLLTGNHAYGCTMILNKPLIDQINQLPTAIEFHDYWISLVACTFGKALLIPQKLMLYRQHASNVSGNVNKSKLSSRFRRYLQDSDNLLPFLTRQHSMFLLFSERYQHKAQHGQMMSVKNYLRAFKKSGTALMSFMILHKLRKVGFMQTLAHYYSLFRLRNKILKEAWSDNKMKRNF